MEAIPTKTIVQVDLDQFRREFGEKVFDTAVRMAQTMKRRLESEQGFTGRIVFTVDCHRGGIGGVEAYVQKKLS